MKFKTSKNEVLPEAETKSRNEQFTFFFHKISQSIIMSFHPLKQPLNMIYIPR